MEHNTPLRLAVVESDPHLARTITSTITGRQDMVLVRHASGFAAASSLIDPTAIDVLVTNAELEDGSGLSLGLLLQSRCPGLGVVAISSVDLVDLVVCIQDNDEAPWSYLTQRGAFIPEYLVHLVRVTGRGLPAIDPLTVTGSTPKTSSRLGHLSPGQLRALELVVMGFDHEQVATLLRLDSSAAAAHFDAIHQALGEPPLDCRRSSFRLARLFVERTRREALDERTSQERTRQVDAALAGEVECTDHGCSTPGAVSPVTSSAAAHL